MADKHVPQRTAPRVQLHRGYAVVPDYLDRSTVSSLLDAVARVRASADLSLVARATGERALHYQVIDGPTIKAQIPQLVALYARVQIELESAYRRRLAPLSDEIAGLNVNITPPGGSYRWHYDRNPVTAVLYLNQVAGGQMEMCPDYRLGGYRLRTVPRVQQLLDGCLAAKYVRSVFGRTRIVEPAAGTLVAMRGDRSLHSVRPVLGTEDRICVVMSFEAPERPLAANPLLNEYLYSTRRVAERDPNYAARPRLGAQAPPP